MANVMERALAILEYLSTRPDGASVSVIANDIGIPASAAHRMLRELSEHGYVRQLRSQGDYGLTLKLASLGLTYLGKNGITEIVQPILDWLASETRELVRLSVIDGDDLVWVAVAQGALAGLRYDPGREQGVGVHLATTSGGRAWLSTMSDEEALMRVSAQNAANKVVVGVRGEIKIAELLEALDTARRRGYATAVSSYIEGMAAMAVPVRRSKDAKVIGCLSIAGPAVRLDDETMETKLPALQRAADEIGAAAEGSRLFASHCAEAVASRAVAQ
ncbi:IclR family transcriptional regulator [Notoacmeibacter sp. MSK16QG-6]|uniref:IclR family transcriptional regulator n=1 Tax=Notoacmeibacter sp. MSK16QG-6 TaxID=2957982 RepID=UPI00209F0540|nr:IclR family transcriptional regulator [Notoacmeibacter sp. MSK16QG-6]MCP1198326.1 IclR family transcriptional regulator [Notoacmeibacter sp. MSK16QG-6]